MTHVRAAYVEAADSAVVLLSDPAVARAWDQPSALAEFGVSGLAGHLAAQIFNVPKVLAQDVPPEPPIPLLEHYARASWIDAALDDDANVSVRRSGEHAAAGGQADLVHRATTALDGVRQTLLAEPEERIVHVPWGPWSLSLDDFLVTRLMEIAVHCDDLAISVGVPTPELSDAAVELVIDLLSRLAVRRHGPTAVLRALSRAERAPESVSAF